VITDSYGDGMYGSQWGGCSVDGNYSMVDDQSNTLFTMTAPNADFGTTATHSFCVTSVYTTNFAGTPTTVCVGNSVQFSDLTSGATGWTWTFPGGTPSSSTSQNPSVTYNTPGTYDVTLASTNGPDSDTKLETGYITVVASPTITQTVVGIQCFGDCDGTISTVASGGSGGYTYLWGGGESTTGLSNLSAGNYTVTVTDGSGCASNGAYVVNEPAQLTTAMSSGNATCGASDGTATVLPGGGSGSETYVWTPNVGTTATVTGLAIGSYSVVVTDANGCTETGSVDVVNPNAPILTAGAVGETCSGDCLGTLSSSSTGGAGGETYSWDGGIGAGANQTNVCAGTYTVTVTDQNGCQDVSTQTVGTGTAAPSAGFTVIPSTTVMTGSNVTFLNTSSNGTGFAWDFGDGGNSILTSPSYVFTTAGTYTVQLIVSNGPCSDTLTVVITVNDDISGLEDLLRELGMKLYPNPTNGLLFIGINKGLNEDLDIKVVDVVGALVAQDRLVAGETKTSMDLGFLPSGMYFVNFTSNGQKVVRKISIIK